MTRPSLLPHLRLLSKLQGAAVRLRLAPGAMQVLQQPPEQRQLVRAAWWATRPPSPGVAAHDARIPSRGGGLTVRVYDPPGSSPDGAAVLYIHGGGFVLGGLDAAHWLCNELALAAGVRVVSVEYRLAPEHPHPAALEDCYDALVWLSAIGVDATRIAVAGDSAGGNLAAALTLLVRECGGPKIAHQTLIYPLLDTRLSSPSWRRWAGGGIDLAAGRHMVQAWVGSSATEHHLVAPLLADDLSGLPPAHIVLAQCDVLYDDGASYAARLLEAGVPTRLTVYDRMPHGFLAVNRLCRPAIAAAAAIAADISAVLQPS